MVNYRIRVFDIFGRTPDITTVLDSRLWPSSGKYLDLESGSFSHKVFFYRTPSGLSLDKGTMDAIRSVPGVVAIEETHDDIGCF